MYFNTIDSIMDKLMKCKIICLFNMQLHPLFNIKNLIHSERKQLIKNVQYYFNTMKDHEIDRKYNEICDETIQKQILSNEYNNGHIIDIAGNVIFENYLI